MAITEIKRHFPNMSINFEDNLPFHNHTFQEINP